ncbi:unnamed protein product [Clonostachys byssicola]|uniref:Uncharacterized protein n=1 Tax=Clonostachys byssicola TaxID=160290 RepID=A0A9N9Y722_9HYPO|nr:unnamed protein product [Clonostachys byssicola]
MPPEPFRFTGLPSELRNRVYKLLLCDVEEPEDYTNSENVPETIARAKHNVQTSILAVNRQIHTEAKDVLYREIKFVRFGATMEVPNIHVLKSLVKNRCVPVFTMDKNVVGRFSGHVLSYTLVQHLTELPCSSFSCLITHRDLDLFCRALGHAEAAIPGFWSAVSHTITMCAPYQIPPSAAKIHQETLLAPLRRHLRGLEDVVVQGEVDEALATAVADQLKSYVIEEPEVLLEKVRALKEAGTVYFRQGDSRLCSESWSRACNEIRRVRGGAMWATLVSDPEFVRDLAELYFILNINLSQNTIKDMDGSLFHPELAPRQASMSLLALRNAYQGLAGCKMYWQPSDAQMAKLLFRKAKTHRLSNDYADAFETIELAENLLPDDEAIQEEKQIIENAISGIEIA